MAATVELQPQTWQIEPVSEESLNSLTHGVAAALSCYGMVLLMAATHGHGSLAQVAGAAVFSGSMVLAYLASTLYHAAVNRRLKYALRIADHATIYLLIAGTYTPFMLALPDRSASWMLGIVWSLAGLGIASKIVFGFRFEQLSRATYLAMGWLGLLTLGPLVQRVPAGGMGCLLAGGLAYTSGMLFYTRGQVRYAHAVWHVFVMLGSALHFGAVLYFVVPLGN